MELLATAWAPLLLDATLKASVLLGAALLAARLLRGSQPARQRLRLVSVALAGTVLLVPLAALLPSWSVPLLPDLTAQTTPAASVQVERQAEAPRRAVWRSAHLRDGRLGATATPLAAAPQPLPTAVAPARERTSALLTTLALLWLAGAALTLAWQLVGQRRVAALRASATDVDDRATRNALRSAAADLGLRRPVELLEGDVRGPVTWGHTRPVILLPLEHTAWSAERRAVVLLHELSHVQRGDWLARSCGRAACALYWFHPLAWVALRQLVLDQELACDEAVVAAGTRPSQYADHLLALARRESGSSSLPLTLAALPMARRHDLEVRLMSILDDSRRPTPVRRALALAALVVLIGMVPVLAAVSPWAAPAAEPQQQPTTREEATQELSALLRQMQELEQELEPLATRLEETAVEMEPTEEQLEAMEGALEPFERELEEIAREMEPFEVELAQLESRLEQEARLGQMEAGLEPFEGRVQELEARLAPYEEQLEALEAELEPFHSEMEAAASIREEEVQLLEQQLSELAEKAARSQITTAEREELQRLSEQLRAEMEPLHTHIREAQERMRPVFERMEQIHAEMAPVQEQMQAIHAEMEPHFARMREAHEGMEPVLAEMRVIQERMEPMHERMREVHARMEPEMERLQELHLDMEPVHERMREVHREMEPIHQRMSELHERFEASAHGLIGAAVREELGATGAGEVTMRAVTAAAISATHLNVHDGRLRLRGSSAELTDVIQAALQDGGVADARAAAERTAAALLALDVEID